MTFAPTQLFSVLIALFLAGWLYNAIFIDVLAQHIPVMYRRTSIEVVIGVTITLAGAGVLYGGQTMLVLFMLFAASGISMIYGDFRRGEEMAK